MKESTMANGIYSAVSGAVVQTRVLESVANNLANVSTAGYKGDRLSFAECLSKAGAASKNATERFVRVAETRVDLRPGALHPTESKTDVALEGKGFLVLQDGNQTVYTRGGPIRVRQDGVLTDPEGRPFLARNNKPLQAGTDPGELQIDGDGTVRSKAGAVGQLMIVEFDRPQALERLGYNRVSAPAAAGGRAARETQVRQGYLEAANVNAVGEVSSMIVASRAYEAMHNIISTFRQVDNRAASELGQER
jgi:flagellar basal-body rod protein FlgF